MASKAEPFISNSAQTRSATYKSKTVDDLVISTMATMAVPSKHAHHTSLATITQDYAQRVSKRQENYQRFSSSLLKHKNLLVPTRLALKRQRAAFRGLSLQYEPIQSDTFQLELGSQDNPKRQYQQYEQRSTPSPAYERIKSTSNQTASVKAETPHTLPTDISLMYREKPQFFHPITGQYIVQYTEYDDSPSPCSYVLPRKSYREKNAPSYTFGSRCLVEKQGGSRTAWQKQWFAHSNPYTTKVDFNRETSWPTPFHYHVQPTFGFQPTKLAFPCWSISERLRNSPILLPENNPAPDAYDTTNAFRKSTAKSIPITMKSRTGGTQLSINQSTDVTPGPGAHDETKFFSNRHSSPKYSFGKRIPSSLRQDPYVNVLPAVRTVS